MIYSIPYIVVYFIKRAVHVLFGVLEPQKKQLVHFELTAFFVIYNVIFGI